MNLAPSVIKADAQVCCVEVLNEVAHAVTVKALDVTIALALHALHVALLSVL